MSPREKQAIYIFIFALVFYVAQNQYFGWNAKPSNAIEGICDVGTIALWFFSYLWKPSRLTVETEHNHYHFNVKQDSEISVKKTFPSKP